MEGKTEHLPQSDGHIGITAEIKVDLEQICNGCKPCGRCKEDLFRGAVDRINDHCAVICDQYFFGEAAAETQDARCHTISCYPALCQGRFNIAVFYDRPCDQLGEQCNIQKKPEITVLHTALPAIDIDHIGHGLKGVERDPHRQRDPRNRNGKVKQCISRCCQESGIFEEAKKRQVEQDGSCQKPPVRFPDVVDTKCERPVGKRTQEKQQYINGFSIRIEQDTGGKQRRVF